MTAKEMQLEHTQKDDSRAELERKADRARARLLTTIDTLEQRGHEALDVKHQVEEHIVPVASFGAALLVGAGGVVAYGVYRAADARRHRGRERMRALGRLWRNPDRAVRYAPRSMFAEIGRKVVLAAVSMLAVDMTKRLVRELVARNANRQEVDDRLTPTGELRVQ